MPRFLFHRVFDRVRCGIGRQMSRPLNAHVATLSAKSTTFPIVTLSRSRIRLLTRSVVDFFFAILDFEVRKQFFGGPSRPYWNNSASSLDDLRLGFFLLLSFTKSPLS